MKTILKIVWVAVKVSFTAIIIFAFSLLFRSQRLPDELTDWVLTRFVPKAVVVHAERVAFGFTEGLSFRNLRLHLKEGGDPLQPMLTAKEVAIQPFQRRIYAEGLSVPRLPKSYYQPGNHERNERVAAVLPEVAGFSLVLDRPDILGVRPERVIADVQSKGNRLTVDRIHLDWPDLDERMYLDGSCTVDLVNQRIEGEVRGSAKQAHIRPLLVALDVPVALPYMDAFTDVPGKVPSYCGWKVDLTNNDFDLYLDLKPKMGKYHLVPMKSATGKIHLHVYTRGNHLNYYQTFGPITGVGLNDEPLEGTVIVSGTNGYNTVEVEAKSAMPVADLLRIGGFAGEYVRDGVVGESDCKLQFRFPRSMTNNYEVLNGGGHVSIRNGQIMRLKGFSGLVALLAEKVPGVSYLTDSTQASCDYTIENGVIKTDNIYIEGSVFSIKMYGTFDAVKDKLDFVARVQFTKKDSFMGKVLHPLTWPFTKLLLEFKMVGTSENPKWEYLSVIDRIMESVK